MKVEEGFQSIPYPEWHPYTTDLVLPSLLKRLLPAKVFNDVNEDLIRFGGVVINDIKPLDLVTHPPTITQYNQWGTRVDVLYTSEGWRAVKDHCIREGLVAIAYERKHGEFSRIHGFAKSMIMTGYTNVIMCPLSMTDGAARVVELSGTNAMKRDLLPRLTSRDPQVAFTSGQWMTERIGGSDVSQTETVAIPTGGSLPGPTHLLNGFKWFSSATDASMALALARTGDIRVGSRSISLFLVPLRFPFIPGWESQSITPDCNNSIRIHRLKNKLGTKIVPTAELSLNQSLGYQIGSPNEGVKTIAPVLNITRIHSAISSVGSLGRALSISRAYSTVRMVEGNRRLLESVPIHTATLAQVSLTYRGLTHLLFGVIHLLGKSETRTASSNEEALLRLLTSAVKAFAAEKACAGIEECMAALGGQGYMEENIIPRLIRDSLVEKIWEGTINVLSLDLIRAVNDRRNMIAWNKFCSTTVESIPSDFAINLKDSLLILAEAQSVLDQAFTAPLPLIPRPALFLLSYIASAHFLLRHAVWSHEQDEDTKNLDASCFERWVADSGLVPARAEVERVLLQDIDSRVRSDRAMLYGSKL